MVILNMYRIGSGPNRGPSTSYGATDLFKIFKLINYITLLLTCSDSKLNTKLNKQHHLLKNIQFLKQKES